LQEFLTVTDYNVSLGTLAVATVVAVIGFLQWRTARLQWLAAHNRAAFDLFNKRYEIFLVFRTVVAAVVAKGRVGPELEIKAGEALEEARFLFGKDVMSYLDGFKSDMTSLNVRVAEIESAQGPDRTTNLAQQRFFKNKIEAFRTTGIDLFAQYIQFDQKIKKPRLLGL
jgi:hypothetical protein